MQDTLSIRYQPLIATLQKQYQLALDTLQGLIPPAMFSHITDSVHTAQSLVQTGTQYTRGPQGYALNFFAEALQGLAQTPEP